MTDRVSEEKLADILQPSSQAREFKITVVFGFKGSPEYARALALAKLNPSYREEGSGEWVRHSATFGPKEADALFDLFNLVYDWETTEVLVNNKALPYATSLWLPLMWFYRIR